MAAGESEAVAVRQAGAVALQGLARCQQLQPQLLLPSKKRLV